VALSDSRELKGGGLELIFLLQDVGRSTEKGTRKNQRYNQWVSGQEGGVAVKVPGDKPVTSDHKGEMGA